MTNDEVPKKGIASQLHASFGFRHSSTHGHLAPVSLQPHGGTSLTRPLGSHGRILVCRRSPRRPHGTANCLRVELVAPYRIPQSAEMILALYDRHLDRRLYAVAREFDRDRLAWFKFLELLGEGAQITDVLLIDAHDHITGLQSRLGSG